MALESDAQKAKKQQESKARGLNNEKSPDDFSFEGGQTHADGPSGPEAKDARTLASVDSPDDLDVETKHQ